MSETAEQSRPTGRWSLQAHEKLLVWSLVLFATVIRVAALINKGVMYQDFIDASRYMDSARILARTGAYSFAGTMHSAYQMPGYSAFLALFYLGSPSDYVTYLLVKSALLVISVATIYVVYLIGRRIGGIRVGLIAGLALTLSLPHIYTGTLTLSENPFTLMLMLCTLLLIRLADDPSWRNLLLLLASFIGALFIKQAAIGFLPPALVYLLVRRYPVKQLVRHAAVVVAVLLLVLTPWWVRNYHVFHQFVPFTSYEGAPFFEGTFQRFKPYGTGAFDAMGPIFDQVGDSETARTRALMAAGRQRIAERFKSDPAGLVFTYALAKPASAWLLPFYWDRVFGIGGYWALRWHAFISTFGILALIVLSIRSRSRAEFLMLTMNVGIITLGASYYLGLSRYVYPYMPFIFIAVAYVIDAAFVRISARYFTTGRGQAPSSETIGEPDAQ